MIPKLILSLVIMIMADKIYSQDALLAYLRNNSYSLTLDRPFPEKVDTLFYTQAKAAKLILLGESGSHYLQCYAPLGANFIINLNRLIALKTFIIEGGSATAWLCNRYLQTGDTSYLPAFRQQGAFVFWKRIYQYNQTIAAGNRLKVRGVDFESPISYSKALKVLLPASQEPPASIVAEVNLIRATNATMHCKELSVLDKALKRSLKAHAAAWQQFAGGQYKDLYTIVTNPGSCSDVRANRNKLMKERLLVFDAELQEPVYFGQFGQAHTTLDSRHHMASLLNNDASGGFHNKVLVVNTYCQQCTTTVEPVSNWVLRGIEKDIQRELLPMATTDLTLFDFSASGDLTARYLQYGQLLLVMKNQQ